MPSDDSSAPVYQRPEELLAKLIRFDTTNPPGNEAGCISYIDGLLTDAGIETTILARTPERTNVIARLPGRGDAPALLMYGHVDVVTTRNQEWQHPPFEGRVIDDYVWGRGALDMKGGVAMMLSAFLRAKAENLDLPGDVVFAALSDEENGGGFGAKFLSEQHPDQFEGIRYAIGEFGGFSLHVAGRRFYPIMVAEKQVCRMKATVRGRGGHGSVPVRGGAMAGLSRLLLRLDRHRLPVHVTPVTRLMIEEMARAIGGPSGFVLKRLTNALLTDRVLGLLGPRADVFDPLLRNTVSPTVVHASDKVNVIPSEASVELDVRLLPGFGPDDAVREIRAIVGDGVELEARRFDSSPAEADMGLFDTLARILREADPEGVPVPLLLSGATDGRFLSPFGIQTYGFTPMRLPEDFEFTRTIHAADERIPVDAVRFGTDAIYKLLQRFA